MSFGDKPAYRHRLLFLLDEFPSSGRLDFFQTAARISRRLRHQGVPDRAEPQPARGRLRPEQLHPRQLPHPDDVHGARRSHRQAHQRSRRHRDAHQDPAELLGRPGSSGNVSESEQEHGRPLLTPDEILRLPYEDALLLVGGVSPYRARKMMYYLDARFKECVKLPASRFPSAPARRAASPARLLRLGRLRRRSSGARLPSPARPRRSPALECRKRDSPLQAEAIRSTRRMRNSSPGTAAGRLRGFLADEKPRRRDRHARLRHGAGRRRCRR